MPRLQEHASKQSEDWAQKKKKALARANFLREERKRSEEESVRKSSQVRQFPEPLYDYDEPSVMNFGGDRSGLGEDRADATSMRRMGDVTSNVNSLSIADAPSTGSSIYHGQSGFSAMVSETHGGNVQHIKIRQRPMRDPAELDMRFGPDPSKRPSQIIAEQRRASQVP